MARTAAEAQAMCDAVRETGVVGLVDFEVAIPTELTPRAVEIPRGAGPFAARELPSFAHLAGAFADAITGSTRPSWAPAAATFADGLACQRLMDAARTASQSSTWLDV